MQTFSKQAQTLPTALHCFMDENFESELSAGVKLSGGVSVVEMDGNHVLEFNDTSDSETSKANIEIGKQAGEIVVEYKLYVVSDEGKSTIALTAGSKEESGSSSTSSAGEFLRFKTTGSDSRTYEFRGGDSQKTPSVKNGAYLCGKWIELKSVIDTATKTFDVYADGELLGENIAMSCKTENIVMESLDNISFLTGSMDKTHAYIDDVRVSLKTTDSGEGDGDGEDEKTPGELGCIDFVAGGWKLQLPVESDTKPGSVLEKSPQELADGYTSEFFFAATDENGQDAVVFHCPVQGFKTGNTTYARSEMREMLDPKDKTVNWTWQGTHTLVAEQKVTHVPANGKVITSQIHGIEQNGDNANPLVKVLYAYDKAKGTGSVIVYLKNTTEKTSADFAYAYPEVALGEKYRTEIQVVDGTAYVTIDTDDNEPMTVSHNFVAADPLWKDTWYYFKLGNYIQDSVDSSEEAYSDVWVYSSGISHSETVEKTPVESIRIDSSEIQLQPGERTSLSVTVKPIKAYNKAVTWDVLEGADVVAVDAKGYVTALKEGTAVVRATSVDNSIATSTCHVTVQQGEAVQAEKLYSCDFGRESGLDLHTAFNTEFMQVIPESAEGTSVTLEQESEGNVIRFRDNSNNATSKISFVFQPQTDTTTISFRVRIDALGEHKAGDLTFGCMYAVAAGSDSWYSNTTELFRVRNAAKGALGNFSDLTYVLTNAYTPISLNADKVVGNYGDWVDVTYIITPNNGTAKANTTDVYMNGYLVGSGIANRNAIDYVNRLDIHSGTGDKMEFSIDDVKVYKGSKIPAEENVPTPQSLQLLWQMDAGKAAAVTEYTGRQGGNGIRQGDGSQICAVVERVGTNVSDAVRQCDGSRPAFVQRFGGDCAAHSHTKYAETDRRLPELRKAALIQMAGSKGGSGNGGDSAAFYSVGYHSGPCQPGPAHQRQRAVRQRGKIGCQGQGIGVGLFVQMAEPCKLCVHVGSIAAPIILVILLLQESCQCGSGQGGGLFCFRGGGCPAAAQRSGVGYFKLQQFHFTPVLSDRSGAAAAPIVGAAADPGWPQSNRC